ncbi:DUF3016 domain-containing protein [Neiella sp. HB171785]|uniref:DUF3016 domain-containing protein n=1 Tax=Neiella litorisoli TaxID=2771431 RepID=A0A8J6ULD5_9GAMM|nr:DUF3016 domain-containing protein [Neiella litorisoli]MBD1388770.1 DUF3016 domain-containing protein [Neiella litorisoli]
MKSKLGVLILVAGAFCSGSALASDQQNVVTQVTDKMQLQWQDWHEYVDIRENYDETPPSFRQRVFKSLGDNIAENAEKLPQGYILQLLVVDLDLAGDASAKTQAGVLGVRVFDQGFAPAISFKFAVLDADGKVVLDGSEQLRNRNFLNGRGSMRFDHDRLAYDKELINTWFSKQVLPAVSQ